MRLLYILTLATLALTADSVRADYQFTFDSTNYTVGVGQTVNINLYLTQTGSTTGLSSTGLQSGGVQLNYNTTYVGNSLITPNNNTYSGSAPIGFDPANNTAIIGNGSNGLAIGQSALVVGQLGSESPVKAGSGSPNTSNSILLGTFQFTGVSAGSSLTLTSAAFPGSDVNVLADGTVIDSLIANSSAVITVTAVPEPGTMILGGLLASGIAGGYLRRRRLATSA
jgi:hypothetical protein